MRVTTPGKLLVEEIVPEEYRDNLSNLTKRDIKQIFTKIATTHPDAYPEAVRRLVEVGRFVVSRHGREASIGLDDLVLDPALVKWRDAIKAEADKIVNAPGIGAATKQKEIIALMSKRIGEAPDRIKEVMKNSGNALIAQEKSGARGNPSQLMQILFGDVLVVDAQDKPVPIPVLHSYGEGVKPMEYWAASSGARKGSVSVQFSTAQGGYLGKQLSNIGHRVVVTEPDCNTIRGYPTSPDDPDNIGAVLALGAGNYPAGTLITRDMLGKMGNKPIVVRSTITCQAKEGVCSKCSGIREKGDFPPVGEQVGVVSSRALSEPITQAGLRTKHMGGVAGVDDKQVSGFKEMDQFIQVPKNFQGGAILADRDGLVTKIEKAPAGGNYVYVNGEALYVPKERSLIVKKGDSVTAGDMLSDGTPNPAEITKYKGIGEARRYFVDEYGKVLQRNGAAVHRRNLEAVARGFINRIEIKDIDGYNGYMLGDVIPYDDFAATYKPREDSKRVSLALSKNKYMEQPYLHYSIGTRITPAVYKNLQSAGIGDIVVNDREPVFEPVVIRSRSLLASDPDWMTRLSGEGLKKSLLQSAQHGATSTPASTSYFPALANPAEINKHKGGTPLKGPSPNYISIR